MTGTKRIIIIGCGPGSFDYVTPAAFQAAAETERLCGCPRLLDLFESVRGKKVILPSAVESALDKIDAMSENRLLGVLVSGDPCRFSLAQKILDRFGRNLCTIIPGISAAQVALTRLGLNGGEPRYVNLHHGFPKINMKEMMTAHTAFFFMGSDSGYDWLADLANRVGKKRSFYWCENLTLSDEHIYSVGSAELERGMIQAKKGKLVIVVMVPRNGESQT